MPNNFLESLDSSPQWQQMTPQDKQAFLQSRPEFQTMPDDDKTVLLLNAIYPQTRQQAEPPEQKNVLGRINDAMTAKKTPGTNRYEGPELAKAITMGTLGGIAGGAGNVARTGFPWAGAIGAVAGSTAESPADVLSMLAGGGMVKGLNKIKAGTGVLKDLNPDSRFAQGALGALKGYMTGKAGDITHAAAADEPLGEAAANVPIASTLLGGAAGQAHARPAAVTQALKKAEALAPYDKKLGKIDRIAPKLKERAEQAFNESRIAQEEGRLAKDALKQGEKNVSSIDRVLEKVGTPNAGDPNILLAESRAAIQRDIIEPSLSKAELAARRAFESTQRGKNIEFTGRKLSDMEKKTHLEIKSITDQLGDEALSNRVFNYVVSPSEAGWIGGKVGGVPGALAGIITSYLMSDHKQAAGLRAYAAKHLSSDKYKKLIDIAPAIAQALRSAGGPPVGPTQETQLPQ